MDEETRKVAFICSKGSLDMAYPALVMGWAALGNGIDVTIFFTFWGMDIIRESRIVEPVPVLSGACDDEDDVKFLACAISGNATCVVSGDRALLRASGHEGIEVVTPRDFVTRFLGE